LIKYLGSKRKLLNKIYEETSTLFEHQRVDVLDLFSGSARVGHMFKSKGYSVVSNDHNAYAYTNALCYVQADESCARDAQRIIEELNKVSPSPGFITETYCLKSRFFQPFNGERIDAIRARIEQLSLPPELKAVVLVSLIEAADRVDSTTGVQMAYLKQWAARSFNALELRLPALLPRSTRGCSLALKMDALEGMKYASAEVDLTYLDPPYNQHKYHSNYHIWETLVLWDFPEVYGVACKRIDGKQKGGLFYSKKTCKNSFIELVNACESSHAIVSFSNEGFLTKEDIESCLKIKFSRVRVVEINFDRYIGHSIGKHDKQGNRIGDSTHAQNIEYLFIASRL